MLISNQINDVLLNHPFYAGIIAFVIGYSILHFLRQRRLRRREPDIDIPNFLRGGPDNSDHASSGVENDWVEVHPLPRKIR